MQTKTIKNIFIITFVILCVAIIVGGILYTALNWNSVKNALSGKSVYNTEQVQQLVDDGYSVESKADEVKQQRIDDLQNTLERHETKLIALNNELGKLGYEITDVADYITAVNDMQSQIDTLIKDIETIRTEIALYKHAWNDYTDKAVVTFIRENHNEQLIVAKGEKITKAGFSGTRILEDGSRVTTYYGWTLDGETIVDLTNYVVNESMTFYILETKE